MGNIYTDIDFNLVKSDTNDFTILESVETIRQSIRNNIFTKMGFSAKYEKPEFGSNVIGLLSEKPTKFTALQIREQIKTTLENYEPRITINLINIDYNGEKYSFEVVLIYTIISLSVKDTLTLNLRVIQ